MVHSFATQWVFERWVWDFLLNFRNREKKSERQNEKMKRNGFKKKKRVHTGKKSKKGLLNISNFFPSWPSGKMVGFLLPFIMKLVN